MTLQEFFETLNLSPNANYIYKLLCDTYSDGTPYYSSMTDWKDNAIFKDDDGIEHYFEKMLDYNVDTIKWWGCNLTVYLSKP